MSKLRSNESGIALLIPVIVICLIAAVVSTAVVVRRANTKKSNQTTEITASDQQTAGEEVVNQSQQPITQTAPESTPASPAPQAAKPKTTPSPVPDSKTQTYDGIGLNGSVSGSKANLTWKWGPNIDPSGGFKVYYTTKGPSGYPTAPSVSIGANQNTASVNMPTAESYFFSVCPSAKPANDNTCSNSFVASPN